MPNEASALQLHGKTVGQGTWAFVKPLESFALPVTRAKDQHLLHLLKVCEALAVLSLSLVAVWDLVDLHSRGSSILAAWPEVLDVVLPHSVSQHLVQAVYEAELWLEMPFSVE